MTQTHYIIDYIILYKIPKKVDLLALFKKPHLYIYIYECGYHQNVDLIDIFWDFIYFYIIDYIIGFGCRNGIVGYPIASPRQKIIYFCVWK